MKKNTILLLGAAVLLLGALTACNKQNPYPAPDIPPVPENINAARFVSVDPDDYLQSLTLTEGGTYQLVFNEKILGPGKTSLYAGDYSTEDGIVYRLNGYGSATIHGKNKAAGNIVISLDPTDIGGPVYSVEVTVADNPEPNTLYRRWTVEKTRLSLSGEQTFAADFQGCNINAILAFLKDNGVATDAVLDEGTDIRTVDISGFGEITILYANGKANRASFESTGENTMNISWVATNTAIDLQTGKATVSYQDGRCIIEVQATIRDGGKHYDTRITWVLVAQK